MGLTGLAWPRHGPFWNFWGLDHDQNDRVTDVATDMLGFANGDPERVLRPTPSPPLWLCNLFLIEFIGVILVNKIMQVSGT